MKELTENKQFRVLYFIGIFLIIIVVLMSFPEAISSKFKNNFFHFEFLLFVFELLLLFTFLL